MCKIKMEAMDLNIGRIYRGKCYYSVREGDFGWTHDAGPFSDRSCNCHNHPPSTITDEEINKAKQDLKNIEEDVKNANEHLVELIKNIDTDTEIDISVYTKLWRFLELPKNYWHDYNLISSLERNKTLLCTKQRSMHLMFKSGEGWCCKYG